MKIVALFLIAVLTACTKSSFEFRGYTESAKCVGVIGAEESLGATIVSRRSEDLGDLGLIDVTRMNTNVYDVSMIVDVGCEKSGDVWGIWYMAKPNSSDEEAAIFDHLSHRLRAEFGEPRESQSGVGRTREFRCDGDASLNLSEGNQVLGNRELEVAIYVEVGRICGLY